LIQMCEHLLGDPVFQSPCGVLGVCRRWIRPEKRFAIYAFQSPYGVLGVCRTAPTKPEPRAGSDKFQSPYGVLGVCRRDGTALDLIGILLGVSVPFRGFRGLQGLERATPRVRRERRFSPLPGF